MLFFHIGSVKYNNGLPYILARIGKTQISCANIKVNLRNK